MCTVSWLHEAEGYQLLCNRDEKRSRLPAREPRVFDRHGVKILAPADGDHLGAWIGVNEFGITVCLVNGPAATMPRFSGAVSSRGLVPLQVLAACCLEEVSAIFWRAELAAFLPFNLVALEPGLPASLFTWDGEEKAIIPFAEPWMPLVSSSFDEKAARAFRQREFQRIWLAAGRLDGGVLMRFHESHAPGAGPYSPCMHRADAETVSFSWVSVTPEEAGFFYSPAAPCRWEPGTNVRLPLRH